MEWLVERPSAIGAFKMSQMRKLIESMDSINEGGQDPEKEQAFKELGLDAHQWEVFSLTWDYRQTKIDSLEQEIAEALAGEDW